MEFRRVLFRSGKDEVGAYNQDAVGRDRLPGLRLLQGLGHDGNRGPAAGGAPVEAGRRLVAGVADGVDRTPVAERRGEARSEEHTSELQSLMRISYAVFCLKKKHLQPTNTTTQPTHEQPI